MLFKYDLKLDSQNCIYQYSNHHEFCVSPIPGRKDIISLLSRSQPPSIFNYENRSLICYGSRSVLLKRAIIIPNNYELFLSPWIADGSFSYPHPSIRHDWKAWFPSAHNAIFDSATQKLVNSIRDDAFDGLVCALDENPKYIIKNHDDANNYWHWTFEWLPRLFALKELMNSNRLLRNISLINIGSSLNSFQQQWLNIMFGSSLKVIHHSSPILCENLLWVTPVFPAHHSKETLTKIRESIIHADLFNEIKSQREALSRIYILRGNARNGRHVVNEKEIIEGLQKLGFKAISMDGLSIYEQAFIFSSAEIVIGPHGSAFVNMVFCGNNCRILELFGPGYLSGHDYSLALCCGLDWDYLEGETIDHTPTFVSDFYINNDRLLAKVHSMISDVKGS